MTKTYKVAVIGCGMFANSQYLPNIRREAPAEIVAAVDIVFERAEKACRDYNIPNAYHSVYELIENCDFDIAIDSSSIQAHHEINMAVLSAGKHLISQKPAAPTVELLTEQIELAKKMGVKFACAPVHPMRYDLNVAKGIMAEGTIGDPYYAKCNLSHGGPEYFQYRAADPSWFFEPGAGALVDMGVHGLQIVTSIFGLRLSAFHAWRRSPLRCARSEAAHMTARRLSRTRSPDQHTISLDFWRQQDGACRHGLFTEGEPRAPARNFRRQGHDLVLAALYGKPRAGRVYGRAGQGASRLDNARAVDEAAEKNDQPVLHLGRPRARDRVGLIARLIARARAPHLRDYVQDSRGNRVRFDRGSYDRVLMR